MKGCSCRWIVLAARLASDVENILKERRRVRISPPVLVIDSEIVVWYRCIGVLLAETLTKDVEGLVEQRTGLSVFFLAFELHREVVINFSSTGMLITQDPPAPL